MFVNSISGERGNPHSHTFSNRMVRPGEIIYMDHRKLRERIHDLLLSFLRMRRAERGAEESL